MSSAAPLHQSVARRPTAQRWAAYRWLARRRTLPELIAIGLVIVSIALNVYPALHAVIPVYWEDEAGYLSNSQVIAGFGTAPQLRGNPYYIGWSLVISPLWWILRDPQLVYRGAVMIAALCGIGLIAPLALIGRRLGLAPAVAVSCAAVITLAPSRTVMSGFALSENFLALMVACAVLASLAFGTSHSRVAAAMLGLSSAAVFITHGRGVGVLGVTIVWFLIGLRKHRMSSLIGLAVAVVVGLGGFLAYRSVAAQIYGSASGREDKGLTRLFDPTFIPSIESAIGQGWYVVIAWLGIASLGLVVVIGRARSEIRSRSIGPALWLAAALLTVLVISVTFIAPVIATGIQRLDVYTYGRYLEPFVVPVAFLGLVALVLRVPKRTAYLAGGLSLVVLALFMIVVYPVIPRAQSAWWAPINVGAMLVAPWPSASRWVGHPWLPLTVLAAVAVAASVLIRRFRFVLVGLLAAFFVVSSLVAQVNVVHPFTDPFYSSLTLRTVLKEPLLRSASVDFDSAGTVSPSGVIIDRTSDDAYQVLLAPRTVPIIDSTTTKPTSELVISRKVWPEAAALGAKKVADDTGLFDNALWVMPGKLQDELAAEGRLQG
jgi:hypothetical protein